MQSTTIKSWAEDDRPREKLNKKGRAALSDAELLAILIGSGTRNVSALELSRSILSESQNCFAELSKVSINDLQKFKGIGEAKAITIYAAMEIARRRSEKSKVKKFKIQSSKDAYEYLHPKLMDLCHEEFHVLYLNRGNDVLGCEQISKGGISGTVADGKLIFHKGLELKSSGLILAHNHPSGQLKPSEADLKLTESLVKFGKFIDLQVLDHLIFSDNNYFSFADEGIM